MKRHTLEFTDEDLAQMTPTERAAIQAVIARAAATPMENAPSGYHPGAKIQGKITTERELMDRASGQYTAEGVGSLGLKDKHPT